MVIINQVGINTSFLDLGFNNLRKVPNLALRKLVRTMMMIMFEVAVIVMENRKLVRTIWRLERTGLIEDEKGISIL